MGLPQLSASWEDAARLDDTKPSHHFALGGRSNAAEVSAALYGSGQDDKALAATAAAVDPLTLKPTWPDGLDREAVR